MPRVDKIVGPGNAYVAAAKALVDLKKRDVTIAKLTQDIARADWHLGKDLLAFQLVYLGVGKDAAVYQTAFWINKRLDVHRDASLGF